jgi:pimeloyl-ACP methyl ester carboxylesterase
MTRLRSLALLVLASACGGGSSGDADGPPGADGPRGTDAPPSADAPPAADAPPHADGAPDPCFPTGTSGHHVFGCDGIDYDVEVPASCPPTGCGVIVDVHGLTMSADMLDNNDGLRARGAAAGFVVIQPNANPDPPQSSWSTADDPKILDFMTRAIAFYGLDEDRVHFTGFSQGGFMSWRFLCNHADVFASIAPAAAASNCGGMEACTFTGAEMPSQEIPVLYMHGRAEQNYIPWTCAQPQVDAMVAAWGLTSAGIVESGPAFTRERFTDASGTVVEFLAHDYYSDAQIPLIDATRLQGHCFPGSTDPGGLPGQLFSFKCEQPAAFVWGEEIVEFFVAHPRQ